MGQTPYPRLFAIAALTVAASVGALAVRRTLADRSHLVTGEAKWIWDKREIPAPAPRRFTAERRFALAPAPARARVAIFVDRSYVLSVNGERVGQGEKRAGDTVDIYEVARFLRAGENRIVVEASSENGVGGILFTLVFGPGGPAPIFSDERWTVNGAPAIAWGKPPMYPWGYPRMP